MRSLSSTLLAAQKQESRTPCVKIQAVNKTLGVLRQGWTRLYTGTESDYFHGLTIPADGSLVRVRITPVSDSRKLYRQRVANPGPGSDFSQWIYTSQYDTVVAAAASTGAEVSIIWIKSNREIRRMKSTDYGVNWGSPELIDYAPTTSIYGITAAYKPNGDLAVFFADQATLYVKKCISGTWQTKASWDKTAGDLSGVSCIYDSDWDMLVTGKDTAGNCKLWSLVYGDGGEVTAGSWSALKEIAAAAAGGDFSYAQPFLDKTDTCRCFFIEKYTGSEAYKRPFRSYAIPGTQFAEGLWREPVPFNLSSEYGLAMAHYGDYGWLSSPAGVWRTPLDSQMLEVTADILSIRQELDKAEGSLKVELSNNDGRYAAPGQGDLAVLEKGCQLEFHPGYLTVEGEEYSEGRYFTIESFEHTSAGGKASFIMHARDGWGALNDWRAKHQFRWNKTSDDFSVKDIIKIILARAGLKLSVITQSAAVTGFYPDFTVNPGNSGREIIRKLLTFIPDELFIEGNTAYLVNPQATDTAVYSYGTDHAILEGKYRQAAMEINRAQVEGWDASAGEIIIVDTFAWDEINRMDDRLKHIEDRNLNTVTEAGQRGAAVLRQAEIEAEESIIMVPVNCGQQLFDVVSVTDARAGLSDIGKRVTGMTLVCNPARGEYFQRIGLGRV